MERKKVGIFIDFAIRIPSFNNSYTIFKKQLFDDKHNDFDEGEENVLDTIRFYWKNQLKDPLIEEFYVKTICKKTDLELKNSDWREYFFNEEHYKKFIEDYSFNLYSDAEVICKKDIDIINIAQQYLFDIVLIDEYMVNRKKANTMYFISKSRLLPFSLVFWVYDRPFDESEYFAVWNPKKNSEQENGEGLSTFELWFKDLELRLKKEIF